MKVVIVYESMYGNTHLVADEIGAGFAAALQPAEVQVAVVPVGAATAALIGGADLLVVGGPTHVHGMTRASTRSAAVDAAHKPDADLVVDPDAEGPGLRDWFDELARITCRAAAFDTRIDAPPVLTGRAAKGIAKRLRDHGCTLVVEPESFLVTKDSHLKDHEQERARAWGAALAASVRALHPAV